MNTKNYLTHTKKYNLILSAVHMVYRLVNSTFNVQELALRLTRLLCQFIKASSSSIYILDPVKGKVSLIAIFDNKINILVEKKKDLAKIPSKELKVTQGGSITEKHIIGLPLVSDENIGAIFIKRKRREPAFTDFDREMLAVVAEQAVTAIKNLQLYEKQQEIILGSIEFIGKLLKKHGHSLRTAHMPAFFQMINAIAKKMKMNSDDIGHLYYACILRDAGAIDVPYNFLLKRGQLTKEEFKLVRKQPKKNVDLLKPVEFLKPVLPIILYHHEKYDGSGYPSGLKGNRIPLGARVMAVVEAFEAMTVERPYKTGLSVDDAIAEIRHNSGTQFDPKVVDVFVELSNQKKFRNYLSSSNK
ncbi:MAG: HD domain-containing protein [Candidatus Omnitrophica bacterium]|nr:HD domain-containing protein [Candidatus Omnitrophota bacterium]MBU1996315.1 HD domain-containing protein [Candidatus Omnitrophota bacterium]MBU4334404.1 HD domain-containing protein [Candidatus Omnitrophota bacterium]